MGKRDPKYTTPGCTFLAVEDQGLCLRHGGVAPARPTMDAPIDAPGMRLCGATTRTGGCCKQPAMRGGARCRIHGGSAPAVRRKAAEVVAEASIMEVARHYGVPRDVSPIDALTEELHRTQGHVDWLAHQIPHRPQDASLLAVYTAERNHLAKLADAMVRSNVEQRRVVLAEETAQRLELAINSIVGGLRFDPASPHVRQVVAHHLRSAAGLESLDGAPPLSTPLPMADDTVKPVAF